MKLVTGAVGTLAGALRAAPQSVLGTPGGKPPTLSQARALWGLETPGHTHTRSQRALEPGPLPAPCSFCRLSHQLGKGQPVLLHAQQAMWRPWDQAQEWVAVGTVPRASTCQMNLGHAAEDTCGSLNSFAKVIWHQRAQDAFKTHSGMWLTTRPLLISSSELTREGDSGTVGGTRWASVLLERWEPGRGCWLARSEAGGRAPLEHVSEKPCCELRKHSPNPVRSHYWVPPLSSTALHSCLGPSYPHFHSWGNDKKGVIQVGGSQSNKAAPFPSPCPAAAQPHSNQFLQDGEHSGYF